MTPFSDDHLDRLRNELNSESTRAGRYLLGEIIGEGGMATVYRAEDTDLERTVALKAIRIDRTDKQLAERMMREAKIVARLEHASIVPIHDVGRLPDGRVYYTMKLVRGRTLREVVESGTLRRELLNIFERICEGIAFAHSRGVIHRDLKPDNVMIGEFGQTLVMDWGIAKVTAAPQNAEKSDSEATVTKLPKTRNDSDPTIDGTIMGTPAYMAPEQARGRVEEIDLHTDIYALGAVLYFMLTGSAPYTGEVEDTLNRLRNSAPPPGLRERCKSIPRPLEAICRKAMAMEQEDRYESVLAVAADIVAYSSGERVSAYQENLLEQLWRFISNNKLIVAIVLVYALTRIVIYIMSRL